MYICTVFSIVVTDVYIHSFPSPNQWRRDCSDIVNVYCLLQSLLDCVWSQGSWRRRVPLCTVVSLSHHSLHPGLGHNMTSRTMAHWSRYSFQNSNLQCVAPAFLQSLLLLSPHHTAPVVPPPYADSAQWPCPLSPTCTMIFISWWKYEGPLRVTVDS